MQSEFIKLTADTGGDLWLRQDTIESIFEDGPLTEIVTEEKPWYVRETAEEIFRMMRSANRPEREGATWTTTTSSSAS